MLRDNRRQAGGGHRQPDCGNRGRHAGYGSLWPQPAAHDDRGQHNDRDGPFLQYSGAAVSVVGDGGYCGQS